jgi:hypothetical protein
VAIFYIGGHLKSSGKPGWCLDAPGAPRRLSSRATHRAASLQLIQE